MESDENNANAPSRRLSCRDSKLSAEAFVAVDHAFGGFTGHSFDLMALDSNAVMGKDGKPLPHFTPRPSPCSAGVNPFCQDLSRITEMSYPYFFPLSVSLVQFGGFCSHSGFHHPRKPRGY